MTTTYQNGDTIRLKGTFYTFAGVLADLTANPTLKVYQTTYETHHTLLATIAPASIVHPSTGVYYYDYTIANYGEHTYEFSGTSEGTTVLRRGKFTVSFDEA